MRKFIDQFTRTMGYSPNLDDPKTMSEKVLIRKLYDRRPILVELTDKLRSKDWVKGRSDAVAIPTLGTGFEIGDILKPPFVVKPTGYSGQTFVIRDKKQWPEIKKSLIETSRAPYGQDKGQWAYKEVPFELIYESVLEDFIEFKFFCFDGRTKVIRKNEVPKNQTQVGLAGVKCAFFWRDGSPINVTVRDVLKCSHNLPEGLDLQEMVACADKLSEGIDFVRVDLYWTPETIYYGEHTFYPSSGYLKFVPENFDRTLGDLWTLSYR